MSEESIRRRHLTAEYNRLQRSVADESKQTVEAIRSGEVDAFVVGAEGQEKVYVLKSPDPPYRLIVEEMGDGAVTLTPDGAISYCNRQFARLTGIDRQEILGRFFEEFVTEDARKTFRDLMQDEPESSVRCEIELIAFNQEVIPVMVTLSLLPIDTGGRCCLVIADLREQRIRENLRLAKESAERANALKDEFLAMASHELRTPITAILGWTWMMKQAALEPETAGLAIDSIHQSTTILVKLVDDLLDIARLSSGKLSIDLTDIDLRDVVRLAIEAEHVDIKARDAKVVLRLPDVPVCLTGDAERLQQVVVNLLSNAVKFSSPGGEIDVSIDIAGNTASLRIRDYGAGIDASFLPHVFERFRQGESSTRRSHRGLGLGLSIAHQLVEAHRGSITAFSEGKDTGSTFTVEFPLIADATAPLTTQNVHDELIDLKGIHVLLVDDEQRTLDVFATALLSCNAGVTLAHSAAEAVRHCGEISPDVIVTDISMPVEDGFDLLKMIHSNRSGRPPIPMIAMTAQITSDEGNAIVASGFVSYLLKPFTPDALAREILRAASGASRTE